MTMEWRPLRDGDTVDVIAPGFATDRLVLSEVSKVLKSWGLVPRIPKDIIKKHFFMAAPDEVRSRHLRQALLSDSKVIWCLRGGYGALRLLPELSKIKRPVKPKLLVGISDVTSLHTWINTHWGWPSFHASLLDRLSSGRLPKKIQVELQELLFGKKDHVTFRKLKPMNAAAKKALGLKAPIVGGNLVTLQSSLGTPYDFDFKDRFVFLEELGERGYRIDRILVHFEQARRWQGCKGVLLGHFLGGNEPQGKNFVWPVLKSWAQEQSFPVYSGLESGHGENLRALPFMTMAELSKDETGSFRLLVETGVQKSGVQKR